MPDFDLSPSASFISSKDGETPSWARRRLMNIKSSYCFFVSIGTPGLCRVRAGTKPKQWRCSSLVRLRRQASSRPVQIFATGSDTGEPGGEGDDRHALAGLRRWGEGRANHQAIGTREQRQHRAVLAGEGLDLDLPVVAMPRPRPEIVLAPVIGGERHAQPGGALLLAAGIDAEQPLDRRPEEEEAADQAPHPIA